MRAFERQVILFVAFVACGAMRMTAQTSVVTWHNDNWRDGLNSTETILNQSNVNAAQFGKLCSAVFDGQIFGQPLVVSSAGVNTVYVATENDSVYSVNGANCSQIKSVSLLQAGEEPVSCKDVGGQKCLTINPIIGILGTPVLDLNTNTIYLVSQSELTTGTCKPVKRKPVSCFIHRLHALDMTTFAEKFGGPVAIAGSDQAAVFTSNNHIQRTGLLELRGVMPNGDGGIYIGFSEMDGTGTPGLNIPSGWVFAYDSQNLAAPPYVWSSTPNGEGGGIWASGAGLAAGLDAPGGETYLYLVTGDGDFTANTGGSDYGNSFVKLSTTLIPSSYFTPFSQACMTAEDLDFGSSGVMLIPDSGSSYFAVAPSKPGAIYAISRSSPGGYSAPTNSTCPAAGTNLNVESFQGSPHHFYTTPVSWNSQLYFIPMYEPLAKYSIDIDAPAIGTTETVTPAKCILFPICTGSVVKSSVIFQYGTNLSMSASGTATGTAIVWAANGNGWPNNPLGPAVLYAFDAEHSVSKAIPELWDSTKCPTRDATGNATKFVVPTIANGFVYLGSMDRTDSTNTRGELDVFGLTSGTCD